MVVKLLHNGHELSCTVIYNFRMISNIILVRFDHCLQHLEKDILIYKENNTQKWLDTGNLESGFPAIYEQLHYKLRNVFREASRYEEDSRAA
jgi:hypothetical protein